MLLLLILLTKVVTMVLTLTSCNERTEISGAGGVFTSLFYLDTGNLYSTNRSAQLKQNIAFQYDVVNSAYGLMRIKNQISNSSRVNFGASQTPLSEADKRDYPTLVSFPVFAG